MSTKKYHYVGRYSDGGSQNSFYKVKGRKYGFKSFPNKSLATFAHAVQSDLSKTDLAPRVYSPVCRIRVPNYFMGKNGKTETHMVLSDWGYLTEIAKPYVCTDPECDDCMDGMCENHDSIMNLLGDMEDCGIDYIDAHPANLGYIFRNDEKLLVAIDFGAESLCDNDGRYPEVCWDGAEDMECCCEQCRSRYSYA